MLVHDIFNELVRRTQQQTPQRHGADEFSPVIQHIADIDGLFVHTGPADAQDRLLHRQRLLQIHKLHRHDASGGILRVAQQQVDIPPCLRACVGQQLLHHVGRHFLHQVRRIIRHQAVDDIGRLFI